MTATNLLTGTSESGEVLTVNVPTNLPAGSILAFNAFGAGLVNLSAPTTTKSITYSIELGAGTAPPWEDKVLPLPLTGTSGSIPAGVQGSITYYFTVKTPTVFYSALTGGTQFSGILRADPSNKSPTLGPDGIGYADTGSQEFSDTPLNINDPLMPGKYTYTVTRNGLASGGENFNLAVKMTADEAGNNIDWAKPIVSSASGMVSKVDDADVYKFTLAKPSSVLVSIAVEGQGVTDGFPPINYDVVSTEGATTPYLVLGGHSAVISHMVDTTYQPSDMSDASNNPLDPGDYYIIVNHPITSGDIKYKLWINSWGDNAANRPLFEDFGPGGPKSSRIGDLTNANYTRISWVLPTATTFTRSLSEKQRPSRSLLRKRRKVSISI